MKVASVADLRNNFARLSKWIEDGEKIEIRKRGKIFAVISPPPARKWNNSSKKKVVWPDFMARLKKIYPVMPPGKPLSEIILEDRERF